MAFSLHASSAVEAARRPTSPPGAARRGKKAAAAPAHRSPATSVDPPASPSSAAGRRRRRRTTTRAASPVACGATTSSSDSPSPSSATSTSTSPPLRLEDVSVEVEASIEAIGRDAWDAIAARAHGRGGDGGDNPFLFYAFLHAAEASGSVHPSTGWLPQHLVAKHSKTGAVLGYAPCYVKGHGAGEYVFDSGWASAYQSAGGRYYPKLLGAVPFSPVPGPRLLVADDEADPGAAGVVRTALARAFAAVTVELKLSSAHINFTDAASAAALAGAGAGFVERVGVQYHWANRGYASFADFEAALKQSKRKSVRQERKKVAAAGLAVARLAGSEVSPPLIDRFYSFYVDTAQRKWGEAYFTRDFFHRLFDAEAGLPPERLLLVVAAERAAPGTPGTHAGAVVAGALNLVGSNALFGRHWGAAPGAPFVGGLHFELAYYAAIEEAIARGLGRVEAGAQGEHKLARGYTPVITRSSHFLRDPGLRGAVADFCAREAREMDYVVDVLSVRENPYKE